MEREEQHNEYSGCLVFKVKSNRFLRRMMRKLINSVLMDASDVLETYADRDKRLARKKEWKQKWRERRPRIGVATTLLHRRDCACGVSMCCERKYLLCE